MNEHDRSTQSPRGLPTEELSGLRLLLRDDLTFTLQQFAGETCYVIEDPVHSVYYRIGCSEYTFLSLLNGRNTVNEAIAKSAVALGANALSEQEVSTVCRWLTDNHLAGTPQSIIQSWIALLRDSASSCKFSPTRNGFDSLPIRSASRASSASRM